MKKSHRKDVIIARIIFAVIVLVLIALIVFGVKAFMKYRAAKEAQNGTETQINTEVGTQDESQQEESQQEEPGTDDNDQWLVEDSQTEDTQEPETEGTDNSGEEQPEEPDSVILRAMYGVNIRSGAGTDNSILGSVPEGDNIILLEERDDGWGYIQYGDLTGYVYLEYFLIVEPESEAGM